MIANILTIAGSDPSGGAGIQADIKAISANGGYAMSVITALTAQNTRGVSAITVVSNAMIASQLAMILADIHVDAIKIGMLSNSEVIKTVAETLHGVAIPLVIDPVMVAKSGDRLLSSEALSALKSLLIPRATLITPNLQEAADLLNQNEAQTLAKMHQQARDLLQLGCQAVLLKAGHLTGQACDDVLVSKDTTLTLSGKRIHTNNTHGTGCTLSSAIATHLGKGMDLKTSVEQGKSYVSQAIAQSYQLTVGHGHGPLYHFFDR